MNRSLTTLFLSRLNITLHRLKVVDSTNTYLKSVASNLPSSTNLEGIAATAEMQTSGRGRMGRTWYSPTGEGLYLSLLLKPRLEIERLPLLALTCAIAVYETLHRYLEQGIDIKWPNDLLVHNRKVCGILCEAAFERSELLYAIAGIGVNLNQKEFPEELNSATSLRIAVGYEIDKEDFLHELLNQIDRWYAVLESNSDEIRQAWTNRFSYAYGKKLLLPDGCSGTTRGLTASGSLLIELEDGTSRTLRDADL